MSNTIPGLGGYTCIRNNMKLGYCVELAIDSLLKVCEQVVVADSDSTDGTLQMLERWADKEPRLKIVRFPWTDPRGVGHRFWVDWLNFARSHLRTEFQITLDGDEVLDDSPGCHEAIAQACADSNPNRWFRRNNYWRSPEFVIPTGHCCGDRVVRLGFAKLNMPSDQPVKAGEYPIVDTAKDDGRLLVHHLGFLRPKSTFYAKARACQSIWFNSFDPRLEVGEQAGIELWETTAGAAYEDKLVRHKDKLPVPVQKWLAERGHKVAEFITAAPQSTEKRVRITAELDRSEPVNVLHSGDFGDIIHGLAVMKGLGRVRLIYRDTNHLCKRIEERIHLIEPLLRTQPYIVGVEKYENQPIHWDASQFRSCYMRTQSLAASHIMHYRGNKHLPPQQIDLREPWLLGIQPAPAAAGRVVINRSARYHTGFRWDLVRHTYGDALLFIGLPDEHAAFCDRFGPVEYRPTTDLLAAARLIAGSRLFIGNQSVCLAMAEAMKHARIAEVCPYKPDVIVQPQDDKCQYVCGGILRMPSLSGGEPTVVAPQVAHEQLSTMVTPPGGWQYPRCQKSTNAAVIMKRMMLNHGFNKEDARRQLMEYNVARCPGFFVNPLRDRTAGMFEMALANAAGCVL